MYCNSVAQSYNSENTIIKLTNPPPEPHPIVSLDLNADGMLYDPNAPFLLQVRALAQYFVLKIICEVVARHLVREQETVI
jgi:hypothetical protein